MLIEQETLTISGSGGNISSERGSSRNNSDPSGTIPLHPIARINRLILRLNSSSTFDIYRYAEIWTDGAPDGVAVH
jgi:hypothetical protein